MLKQLDALLLKNKVDKKFKTENEKIKYLIDCIKKHGFIREETITTVPIKHDTCRICNSSSIIFSNHEKICQECGSSEESFTANPFKTYKSDINFVKGTFIQPGSLIIDVIKDGKIVKRDLSKVNSWINSGAEDLKLGGDIKRMTDILDTLAPNYNPIVYDRVRSIILSMWYNVLSIKGDFRGKEKQALQLWCIYYPLAYNKLPISIQRLVSIFNLQIGDAYSYNFIMKDIFDKTSFSEYISIPIGSTGEVELPENILKKVRLVKQTLKDYLDDPLKDKELYGIIYYITKQLNEKKFTLVYLSEKSGISTVIISNESNKIKKYYDSNEAAKRRLLG
jgi:hypothetical protein